MAVLEQQTPNPEVARLNVPRSDTANKDCCGIAVPRSLVEAVLLAKRARPNRARSSRSRSRFVLAQNPPQVARTSLPARGTSLCLAEHQLWLRQAGSVWPAHGNEPP